MTDALALKGWKTTSVKMVSGNAREIEAEYIEQPTCCTKCGVIGNLYRHGIKPSTYVDTPAWGGSVRLVALLQRYRCRECGATFIQPAKGIDADRRMTWRCIDYIRQRCFKATFATLAYDLGCDEKTIRNVGEDFVAHLDAQYKPDIPDWLGIDETKLAGDMRCIITDIGGRSPIDILPTRDKAAVTNWLHHHRDRKNLKGLAIDMWRPYKDAAQAVFPNLPVVIDKFHVVRMAGQGLEQARIRLGKERDKAVNKSWKRSRVLLNKRYSNLTDKQRFNLDMWLDNEPAIATAYKLKESFYDIYDLPKADAIEAYDAWRDGVPKEMRKYFAALRRAMRNWRTEILNYFDHPITNAYTESLNGVAKVINRMGRGYSYSIIRARILYSKLPQVIEPPVRQYRLEPGARMPFTRLYDWPICTCCRSEYLVEELIVSDMVMPDGRTITNVLLCRECDERFHG